jgi:pseudaminic acid cytidylyltransferase
MSHLNEMVAIMPARGGSKRVPHKNIRTVCGQPMLSWPLLQLQKLLPNEAILLSTESSQIRDIAGTLGVASDYLRPDHLADDFTPTLPVVQHALAWYEEQVSRVRWVLVVYPTALLIQAEDIVKAFQKLQEDASLVSVLSAVAYRHPIQRAFHLNAEGRIELHQPQHATTRSQDLTPAWHDAGQFYLCRAEAIRNGEPLMGSRSSFISLPHYRAVDIDQHDDLVLAEALLAAQIKGTL